MRTRLLAGLALIFAGIVPAQDKPEFRARELFYTPIPDAKPAPRKEAAPKAAVVKPPKAKPSRPVESNEVGLQNASNIPSELVGPPLALKFRLLKRTGPGRYDEVDTDTVFRSGDQIRVSVESNDNAHLYIVQQGSSRNWNVLFPNTKVAGGSQRIEPKREYDLPSGDVFEFDEQAGAERLFIVLSRKPEPDLENLIYALSQNGAATPAATSTAEKKPNLMLAQNRIDDAVVNRLRSKLMTRDLVVSKVNDEVPAALPGGYRKEKAKYVATPDQTADARLVVDLTLNHQ